MSNTLDQPLQYKIIQQIPKRSPANQCVLYEIYSGLFSSLNKLHCKNIMVPTSKERTKKISEK